VFLSVSLLHFVQFFLASTISPVVTAEDLECDGNVCMEGMQLLQLHVKEVVIKDVLSQLAMEHPEPNSATAEQPHTAAFASFLEKHGREQASDTADYAWRQRLFTKRASDAERHNSQTDRLWTASINKLADRSEDELQALLGYNGKALPGTIVGSEAPAFLQVSEISSVHSWGHGSSLPEQKSWAHLNATRRIHNQGTCGSCWAVSTASVLQAHVEIHTPSRARSVSVQELVSCVENPHHCGGDGACDGATAELAMDYAMRYGLASVSETEAEAVLPAAVHKGTRCPRREASSGSGSKLLLEGAVSSKLQLDITAPGVRVGSSTNLPETRALGVKAWERLPPNSYEPLMHALVQRGPAAVAVFASKWFPYSHGIFNACERDSVIDHAVALIGYGYDSKLNAKYWLVQNSWGPEWGERGHIRLLRQHSDETDYCGTDSQPKEGTGCDGGPEKVKVCGMCGILYDAVVPHF